MNIRWESGANLLYSSVPSGLLGHLPPPPISCSSFMWLLLRILCYRTPASLFCIFCFPIRWRTSTTKGGILTVSIDNPGAVPSPMWVKQLYLALEPPQRSERENSWGKENNYVLVEDLTVLTQIQQKHCNAGLNVLLIFPPFPLFTVSSRSRRVDFSALTLVAWTFVDSSLCNVICIVYSSLKPRLTGTPMPPFLMKRDQSEEKKIPKGVPLQFDINSVGKQVGYSESV